MSAAPYTFGIVNTVSTAIPTQTVPTIVVPTITQSPISTIAPGVYRFTDGSYTIEWTETYSAFNFKFTTRGSAQINKYSAFSISTDFAMV